MTNLKPCPFCGSEDLQVRKSYVECLGCGTMGPDKSDDASACTLWNQRAPQLPEDEYRCELGEDGPCPNTAVYEAWYRRRDPILGTPSGHLVKVCICEEHKNHPFLCANESKPEPKAQ